VSESRREECLFIACCTSCVHRSTTWKNLESIIALSSAAQKQMMTIGLQHSFFFSFFPLLSLFLFFSLLFQFVGCEGPFSKERSARSCGGVWSTEITRLFWSLWEARCSLFPSALRTRYPLTLIQRRRRREREREREKSSLSRRSSCCKPSTASEALAES